MTNYKITNKRSSKSYFLNDEEAANFFLKNKAQNYSIVNLTKQKRIKTNKIINNITFVCYFVLTICITILIIENYY